MNDNNACLEKTRQAHVSKTDETILSKVLLKGDLSGLDDREKYQYAMGIARAVGLSPTTMPFQILKLQGKERLYADKGTAEQLRASRGLSFGQPEVIMSEGVLDVVLSITDGKRTDYEMGSVFVGGLKGDALANAKMKALTKAKRRATLSFCGLGMLDESEIDSIPNAQTTPVPYGDVKMMTKEQEKKLWELIEKLPIERFEKAKAWLEANHIKEEEAEKTIREVEASLNNGQ